MCVSLEQSAAALRASQKLALWNPLLCIPYGEWPTASEAVMYFLRSLAYCERSPACVTQSGREAVSRPGIPTSFDLLFPFLGME